jgi:hypothetical protein
MAIAKTVVATMPMRFARLVRRSTLIAVREHPDGESDDRSARVGEDGPPGQQEAAR